MSTTPPKMAVRKNADGSISVGILKEEPKAEKPKKGKKEKGEG